MEKTKSKNILDASSASMKPQRVIDIFCHVLPVKYKEALFDILPPGHFLSGRISSLPQLWDMEKRFQLTGIEGYTQVLSLMSPPIEAFAEPEKAVQLAKIANDGMAELTLKYHDRFVAAIASLAINDIDAALKEADRCVKDLGFKGVQLFTPANGKPLDSPEFLPLYEKMTAYDLPIWIHPQREENLAYYKNEERAKFRENVTFGWPFETTLAINRLVFSGILAKYPNLKFITHHGGAMVPFFALRIPSLSDLPQTKAFEPLVRPPIDYFRMFYADTANLPLNAVNTSYQFFGTDHIVFGTDFPFGPPLGQSINLVKQLNIGQIEQAKIFEKNCRALLHLS